MPNFTQSYNRLKHDSSLVWRPGRIVIPVVNFTGVSGTAGVDTGLHTGAPVSQEISTFGVAGILLDTAADEVNTYMVTPADMDFSKRIYCRVHWATGSVTTADTIDWKVWYKALIADTTAILAIGNTGGVALDSVIPQDTVPTTTAYTWNISGEGYIDAGKLSEATEAFLWSIELDAFAAGLTEDKFPLALEIRYTPRRLWGPDGMPQEAKAPTYIAGKTYAN